MITRKEAFHNEWGKACKKGIRGGGRSIERGEKNAVRDIGRPRSKDKKNRYFIPACKLMWVWREKEVNTIIERNKEKDLMRK